MIGGSVIARSTTRIMPAFTKRPDEGRDRADQEADEDRDRDRDDADQQRDAAALQQAGEHVAADAVGAEPMGALGP